MSIKNADVEVRRTKPDFIVYKPRSMDGSTFDTGNEHFLAFDGPDGSLMAVWTQSTFEGQPDQRIVFSRSNDEGNTWTAPKVIAGPKPSAKGNMACWGFPMVSENGRIYVIYSKHIGLDDVFTHTTGSMAGIYSDDAGRTWSKEQLIPMPRSKWDNPDPKMPANWIVWQKPQRLSEGKYFAGFTRWISPAVRPPAPIKTWWAEASVVEFMRFENIDDHPEVKDIKISFFASNDEALQVGLIGHPKVSVIQEPSLVTLPDGRIFCIMRTTTGNPYWSISEDAGRTWQKPEPLRYHDDGPVFLHPCSPCPIYRVNDTEYVFLYHNHDGHFGKWTPMETSFHRRPIYLALGQYRKEAKQPVWFSGPRFLMDNDGVPLGYRGGRADLAMYASFTIRNKKRVLWYPDRKFFLLGKKIASKWLADIKAPNNGTICRNKQVMMKEGFSSVQVGAYYFDDWRSRTERLKGEFADREPSWGWDDGTREIMEQQIDLAVGHGLSFWAFDWYYPEKGWEKGHDSYYDKSRGKTDYKCCLLNEAMQFYLKAKNRNSLKFCLLVANDSPFRLYPRDWDTICELWIGLFQNPTYLTRNGKPLVIIYHPHQMVEAFGGPEGLKKAFAMLRKKANDKKLGGVCIAACEGNPGSKYVNAGFDCFTGYNYRGYAGLTRGSSSTFAKLVEVHENIWQKFTTSSLPYIPLATMGWDNRPRDPEKDLNSPFFWFEPPTPQEIAAHLERAIKWVKAHGSETSDPPLVMIYSWNEVAEGGFLVPTKLEKDAKLRALEKVIKASEK